MIPTPTRTNQVCGSYIANDERVGKQFAVPGSSVFLRLPFGWSFLQSLRRSHWERLCCLKDLEASCEEPTITNLQIQWLMININGPCSNSFWRPASGRSEVFARSPLFGRRGSFCRPRRYHYAQTIKNVANAVIISTPARGVL